MNLPSARSIAVEMVRATRSTLTFDRSPSLSSTILLTGCGRSGTTWLGRVIAESAHMREIFEPFDPDRVRALHGVLKYREYIQWSADRDDLIPVFQQLLEGSSKSRWADGQSRPGFFKRRLVKEIRLCQSLGWVGTAFPDIPMVHVVRNPYWNAQSRLRLGWPTDFSRFTGGDLLACNPDLAHALTLATTPLQKHAWLWAMDNSLALGELAPDRATPVFYENLVNDSTALAHLLHSLGLELPEPMPPALVARPTTAAPAADVAELDVLREVLPIFDLYDDAHQPDQGALQSFVGSRRDR